MEFKNDITKEELSELEMVSFSGQIHVIENEDDFKKLCLLLKKTKILGFDTETKPAFKKGQHNKVALLQLSTGEHAFLFRLNKIKLPSCVLEILASSEYIKAGVAIKDDIKALQELGRFEPKNFVELQDYTKDFGIESNSLKKIAAIVLGFSISKRQRVTNWENETLSNAQILYAATDAWIGYEVYKRLDKK